MIISDNREWIEGCRAYHAGTPLNNNPYDYDPTSVEFDQWEEGWNASSEAIWDEGYISYLEEMKVNPYAIGSQKYNDWYDGFNAAYFDETEEIEEDEF